MEPITREEMYLASICGEYDKKVPKPIIRMDYYMAFVAGEYTGKLPNPITRQEMYWDYIARYRSGLGEYYGDASKLPKPITRIDQYLYSICGIGKYTPEPITRVERFLSKVDKAVEMLNPGRNLVLGSDVEYTNSSFAMHEYTLTEQIVLNETYTVTVWGSLGDGKTSFNAYVGTGYGAGGYAQLNNVSDGVYTGILIKTKWMDEAQEKKANKILIYHLPSSVSGVNSTINKIKIEHGEVYNTIWTPAPEDIISTTKKTIPMQPSDNAMMETPEKEERENNTSSDLPDFGFAIPVP